MTLEQAAKLTPNELHIKVAELCGWKFVQHASGRIEPILPNGDSLRPARWSYSWTTALQDLPDWAGCLNAAHEAENALLNIDLDPLYWICLREVVTGLAWEDFDPLNEYSCAEVVRASARDRCIALIATLTESEDK